MSVFTTLLLVLAARVHGQTYSETYLPSNAPDHTQDGQYGTNQCGTQSGQDSLCQNAYCELRRHHLSPTNIASVNSVDDFCLFAPPYSGSNATIGDTERVEVSWCIKDGYGTRLIPDGTITGAHFVQTPDYIQINGVGDLTKLNIPSGDSGGELDPHGADGNGNPIGGLVFSSAFGQLQQVHEWTVRRLYFCIYAGLRLPISSQLDDCRTTCLIPSSASARASQAPRRQLIVNTFMISWAASGTCPATTTPESLIDAKAIAAT